MTESGTATHREGTATGRLSIFLAAGEISGDLQAAHLATAIRRRDPSVRLYGCGGHRMQAAGVDIRSNTAELGYVGLVEGLRFRRPMRRAREDLRRLLLSDRPDLVVLVDGERFNGFLIDFLHREGIPFVMYFVPQVWFWGRWRIGRIARRARRVIPVSRAEQSLFRREGARVSWHGHPLLDIVRPDADGDGVLRRQGLDPAAPILALMPGSRWQEIERHGPTLLAAARTLATRDTALQFIMPLAAPHLRPALERQIDDAGLTGRVRLLSDHAYTSVSRCRLALVSSGTATLETALLGVPMVVFYRLHPVTYAVARILVTTRFIAMPNILLDDAVVPELIQGEFTASRLVAEATQILDDPERAASIRRRLAAIPALLGGGDVLDAVARTVLADAVSTPVPAMTPPLGVVCTA